MLMRLPTIDRIYSFHEWRTNPNNNINNEPIYLFNNHEEHINIDNSMFIHNDTVLFDFKQMTIEELLINRAFEQTNLKLNKPIDMVEFYESVTLLNTFYSTRIANTYRFTLRLAQYLINHRNYLLNPTNDDEIIDIINEITEIDTHNNDGRGTGFRAYSFATKFCNRINPKKFPIYDSYVAGLFIWFRDHGREYEEYNQEIWSQRFNEFCRKPNSDRAFFNKDLSDYGVYVQKYKEFMRIFNIDPNNTDFAIMDHYLWTYAKILDLCTNKQQIFDNIGYRPKSL